MPAVGLEPLFHIIIKSQYSCDYSSQSRMNTDFFVYFSYLKHYILIDNICKIINECPTKCPTIFLYDIKNKKTKKNKPEKKSPKLLRLIPSEPEQFIRRLFMSINIISFLQNIIYYFLNSSIIIASSCEHGPSIRI